MNPNNPYNPNPQNQGSQPMSNYSNMAYLNSISAQQQQAATPVTPAAAPAPTHTFNIKRIVIFSVCSIIFVSVLATIAIVSSKDRANLGDPSKEENPNAISKEKHYQVETLNETLAELVKEDAHHDYESPNDFSPNYGAAPAEIIDEYNINIEKPDYSSAASVPAMNSNILNYYLDQKDTIVIIVDHFGINTMLDGKSNILIIYASVPSECDFIGFVPSDFNADGTNKDKELFPEQTALRFTRSELFNQLSSSAEFYIIRKESD